ncbi:transposase [Candidatus Babeliales bacterium]|nr:transposase [Candidatus Babeliales bacterium]MBP9844313.1 transposase [Candidatus Babeliales bacterium]
MNLYLTAQKRVDKKGNETVVYQVSTYFAKPSQHVKIYKKRWTIEKMFRTAKQYLGLQDCQATTMQTHKNHISSVFLAYSHVVIAQKRKGLKSAEEAIRALKLQNERVLKNNNKLKNSIR